MEYEKGILFFLLGLSLIRGILYSTIIPLWQSPDEHWHFEYVQLLKDNKGTNAIDEDLRLAISRSMVMHKFWDYQNVSLIETPPEVRAFTLNRAFYHPPAYYLLCAMVLKILGFDNLEIEAYILRFISVILGTLVVFIGYCVTKELFPQNAFLRIGVPLFIVFLPQYTFLNGGINNDKLAEVIFSLIFLLLIKGTKHRLTLILSLLIVSVVVLGLFTKKTLLASIPLALLFFIIYFGKGKPVYRYTVKILILLLIVSIAAICIYVWNPGILGPLERYTGNIPSHATYTQADIIREIKNIPFNGKAYLFYFKHLLSGVWASFGWVDIFLSDWWYTLLFFVDLIAVIGLVVYGIRLFQQKIFLESWQKEGLLLLLTGMLLVGFQTFIRDNILAHFFPHARMLFVAIIPISLFFMIGIGEFLRKVDHRKAILAIALLLAGFDAVCLYFYIIPYYYGVFN